MKKLMKDKVSEKINNIESLSNPIRYVPTAMFFTKGKEFTKINLQALN